MIFYWQIILSPLPLRPEKARPNPSQREGLLSNRLNRITPVQECDPDWSGHATEGKQGTKKLAT
jgi:hypothetical protein